MRNKKISILLLVLLVLFLLVLSILGCKTSPVTSSPESTIKPIPTQIDPLTDTVVKSDLIVLGTITDLRYEVITVDQGGKAPGKLAYTIFTLTVEKVIKGDPTTKLVQIKVEGGKIGDITQGPTGPYFSISNRVLVCLKREDNNVYTIMPKGGIWIKSSTLFTDAKLEDVIGRIIQIMKGNKIPIALPQEEWPPLPAPDPVSPPKK
jgi:hypothetical protein